MTVSSNLPRPELLLPVSSLRLKCDPALLPFETTAEFSPDAGTPDLFHQDRALKAIEFGLEIPTRGYNVVVIGDTGSGKTSILKNIITKKAQKEAVPEDICYVYNFDNHDEPIALMLPGGFGNKLAKAMDELVADLSQGIQRAIFTDKSHEVRAKINIDMHKKEDRLFKRLSQQARKYRLSVRREEDRLMVVPLLNNEPLDSEAYSQLPDDTRADIERGAAALHESFADFERERLRIAKKAFKKRQDQERRLIKPIVKQLIDALKESFKEIQSEQLNHYFDQVSANIIEQYRNFLPEEEYEPGSADDNANPLEEEEGEVDKLLEYKVNVLVDRHRQQGAPVIFESNPTSGNIMGYLEYKEIRGALKAEHTSIRAGALHKANGGYLVIQIQDIASHPTAWDNLKKALRLKMIQIDDNSEDGRPKIVGSIHPSPIPLQTKVVLIGTPETYYLLKTQDEEFSRLFKVKADFSYSVPRNKKNLLLLAKFMAKVCKEESYLPFHKEAVALIVEEASREVEEQKEITTRLSSILDLMAESDYWARRSKHKVNMLEDVQKALAERRQRHSQEEDITLKSLKSGAILLETKGAVVGQINGLAVYDLGDYAFGIPSRITAQVFVGEDGIVNIDREVKLSGAVHDKGSMIIAGYLGGKYAKDQPLTFSASVTFEQMYSGVEGDSASATELFALLSALSKVPINQSIAVTGSVNQLGVIQPVGGLNEKIEGMFKICQMKGLTGKQGAIIPRRNVQNLMLSEKVLAAVEKGTFHIWAVDTVDEAMEILTGKEAGKAAADGSYPGGTINYLVQKNLAALAAKMEEKKETQQN